MLGKVIPHPVASLSQIFPSSAGYSSRAMDFNEAIAIIGVYHRKIDEIFISNQ
jgi:hypothetical protein